MIAHARRDQPQECCGFLVGTPREILFAVAMPNAASKPSVRYRIDDRAHIQLRRLLRQFSPPLVIRGVYHSHPDGDAVPSVTDIAEALYPEWVHVIVGLGRRRPRIGAFRIRKGHVRSLPLA
jgi:proteasome lid subunit RPN8/RPN11